MFDALLCMFYCLFSISRILRTLVHLMNESAKEHSRWALAYALLLLLSGLLFCCCHLKIRITFFKMELHSTNANSAQKLRTGAKYTRHFPMMRKIFTWYLERTYLLCIVITSELIQWKISLPSNFKITNPFSTLPSSHPLKSCYWLLFRCTLYILLTIKQ